ncbi:outer membrane beta-barrel protein [Fodinibius halophilus]|uniref:Outer membrane protein beta-barrel domain-containing protein n=1 Tax=Fodinibius halophilus TaxID=1736908 RepID=A0A6M1SVD2_9BACT|nr:outer membrane beta-barrel protein [Fodinibius halophilus]NGP87888.1 hypothetical protein [Fodinibius halophilus]
MSKQNNNNSDPLEDFFRKKSQDYNIEYREEDWEKLEARLDKADQIHQQRRNRWIAAAVIALLFAVLSYITYDQQVKINKLTNQLNSKEQLSPPGKSPSGEGPNTVKDEKHHNQIVEEHEQPTNPPPTTEKKQLKSQDGLALDDEQKSKKTDQTNKQKLAISAKDFAEKDPQVAKISTGFNDLSLSISTIEPISSNTMTHKRSSNQASSPNLQNSRQSSRFTFGFLAGPDLSTVGSISNFHSPGYKLGASIEYDITQNLAVSVGIQRTTVHYRASGNQYSPPQGYWSYGVVPNETVGTCILLDIPVNVKYNFMFFKNSRLYASAGLSSYIMLDEDYQFNYTNYQPGLKKRWHQRTGTVHWISNATLSVGYELDFTDKLSLRAQPFVKVPLKKVGWANVSLYSLGSMFSINYKIN